MIRVYWSYKICRSDAPSIGSRTAQVAVPKAIAVRRAVCLQALEFCDVLGGVRGGPVHDLPQSEGLRILRYM